MNLQSLKAKNFKRDKKYYWKKNGVFIEKLYNGYWVTTLYNSQQFKTLKEVKEYINKNNYIVNTIN